MKKRLLSALLAVAMVLSMVPAVVSAEGAHTPGTHTAAHKCEYCGTTAHTWTAWTSTTTLPKSGHYYLQGNVTVTAQTVLNGDLHLCLNGYTVTANFTGGKIFAAAVKDNDLVLTDCTATTVDGVYCAGKLTGANNTATSGGGAIFISNANNALHMYDGILEGNKAAGGGGGVQVNGKMFMYGGEIRNNEAVAGNVDSNGGGGIRTGNASAELYLKGGRIYGNTAPKGAGIFASQYKTIVIMDVEITGNHAAVEAGGIYAGGGTTFSLRNVTKLTGNTAVTKKTASNLHIAKGLAAIDAKLLTAGSRIGVTLAPDRIAAGNMTVVADRGTADLLGFFTSDDPAYMPDQQKGIALKAYEVPTSHVGDHKPCGDPACEDHDMIAYEKWTDATKLPTAGKYYLATDVTATNQAVLTGNLDLCLAGHTVTGPSNKRILASVSGYTLTISDCTAKTENGVYTAGKLTGAVSSPSNGQGGAINLGANDTLYLYDGIITGNRSYVSGGGVQVGGTMYMYGGEISNNIAKDGSGNGKAGGGICTGANARLYLYGGTIKNNDAKLGAGIYTNTGVTLVLSDTVITGNTASDSAAGVHVTSGTITLQGQTQITGNTVNGKAQNLMLLKAVAGVTANELAGDARIGVTLNALRIGEGNMNITTGATGDLAKYFESDDDTLEVAQDTEVYLKAAFSHSHCVCGEEGCTEHTQVTYLAWEDSKTLPKSGSYCLMTDVTVSAQTVLTGDLNLCLHGHTVHGFSGNRILASVSGCTLTLSDCTAKTEDGVYTAGKLTGATHSAASNNSGGAVYLGNNDTFCLYDGILTGNCAYGGGGAVSVGGTMYMYGGEISGNSALGSGAGREGGGIYVNKSGKAYLYGGTVSGNEARVGGGIYSLSAVLEITDTRIVNNKATELSGGIFLSDDAGVKLSGNVQILGNTAGDKTSNLVLPDKVNVHVGTLGEKAKVAVSAAAFRYISGETADCSDRFQSDATALSVIHKDGKLYMDAADGHNHCLCTGAATGCDHTAMKWAPWESSTSLPTSGNYYLTCDVTVNGQTGLDGTALNLCLNGHTVKTTTGRVYYLKSNTRLSITDCAGGGTVTGATISAIMTENNAASKPVVNIFKGSFTGNTTNAAGGAIIVQGSGTLNIYDGRFVENTSIGKLRVDANGAPVLDANGNEQADNAIGGAAIAMYGAGTTLNIYGGTFKNNKTTHVECKTAAGGVSNKGGYGVIYIQGTANIYGGTFQGGEALLGGAFFATGEKASVNLYGGTITGNEAKGGAAISVQSGADIYLKGGTITGNTAGAAGGGAIYVAANSTLYMDGGTLSGNHSTSNGGAVYLASGIGYFNAGTISGNTSAVNGAGIYVNRTTAYLNGTALKNNTAKNNGGGMYGAGAALIRLNKGEISGNKAINGAGVYATINTVTSGGSSTVYYSTVEVNDGITVTGNQAATNGGGLMLIGESSVLTMQGGTVKGNTGKNAGGILVQSGATFHLKGGTVTGNTATVGGGGVYLSTATLNMTGGTVSANAGKANAGGMMLMRGEAVIKGGSVTGNTAENGAGIYISGAKVDIHSVSVTGNKTTKSGAGILIGAKEYTENGVKKTAVPVVNMYGGTVSGNDATKGNAGGVLIQSKDSTFNLKGGTITGNRAAVGAGGVYVSGNTFMNMTGGSITNNEANQGGAIFCLRGTVNVSGGQIHGNTAGSAGGAIYTTGNSSTPAGGKDDLSIRMGIVTVKNMDIYGNTAGTGGAFEAVNFSTLNLENCKIHDNESKTMAGGVYINKVSYGSLTDVQIYDNVCTEGGGGGLCLAVGADVTATGITVENNRADGIGGGIYNRGRLVLTDSQIRANSTTGNGGGIGTFKTSAIPLSVDAGLFVKNTLIEGNRSVKGAGVYMHVGCVCELTDVTLEKNIAEAEGSGIFSGGQTTLTDVTLTGNESQSSLYALYFDASLYDGMTYYTGKKVLQGNIVVKDNQGGEAYLGEGTAIAIPGEGLGADTYLPITLHSGLLTQQVIGVYNYEGGDLEYLITAGNRSITDPEHDPNAQSQQKAQQEAAKSGDTLLYVAIGIFVLIVAAVLILLMKKKKKTPSGESK